MGYFINRRYRRYERVPQEVKTVPNEDILKSINENLSIIGQALLLISAIMRRKFEELPKPDED